MQKIILYLCIVKLQYSTKIQFNMSSASENPENAMILPYKRYEDSIGDETRKSMLIAQMRIRLGYAPKNAKEGHRDDTTIWRYRTGVIYPPKPQRDAIAFAVNKVLRLCPKISGDELFPENYPYTGARKGKTWKS